MLRFSPLQKGHLVIFVTKYSRLRFIELHHYEKYWQASFHTNNDSFSNP